MGEDRLIVIGCRIAEARKLKGWTQGQLAEKSGLSTNTVNRFENGHRVPDALQIIRLGDALSCAPESLLGFAPGRNLETFGLAVKDDKNPGGISESEDGGFGRLLVPEVNDGDEAFRVSSTAMAPLVVAGDYVVVEKADVKAGDMVAFLDQWRNINVRWLREKDGTKFFVAENQEYPPIEKSEREQLVGRVIATVKVTRMG